MTLAISHRIFRLRKALKSLPFVQRGHERRFREFMRLCHVHPDVTIVDIGSGASGTLGKFNRLNPIVAIDLVDENEALSPLANVTFVKGDATSMPFADGEFDVAFCNSLIEHLRPAQQRALVDEIGRVASGYWVQTPNRHFPIEPHQLIPGYQFLPARLRRRLDHRLLGGSYTELLTESELKLLFPDSTILQEKFLGLTKSIIAYRPPTNGLSQGFGPGC